MKAVHSNNTAKRNGRALVFIWVGAFILSNLRATMFWRLLVVGFGFDALPWAEISLWLLVTWLALRSLWREGLFSEYLSYWRKNWTLALFVFVSLCSISWSVAPEVTIYRSLALFFSTFAGSYIGYRYSVREIMELLYHFGAYLLLVSAVVALLIPSAGVMLNEPYTGSWRGVFWHKNHLGAVAPFFTAVYLLSAIENLSKSRQQYLVRDIFFYVISLALAILSRSAAALALLIVLHGSVFIAYVWVRVNTRLRSLHYYGLLGLGVGALLMVVFNLDFVFGLFNRTPTLTGRVPLWIYLFNEAVLHKPWLGYGFGALWTLEEFRVGVQHLLGWPYQVVIADNGFLDILLHVGAVGFLPFVVVLFIFCGRSLRHALSQRTLMSFFPLIVFVYAVFANISFSMFLETETFVWLLIVAGLFVLVRE